MYCGFFDEGEDVVLLLLTDDADHAPVDPDDAPTFRVFGASGAVSGGTGTAAKAESGSVSGATNASPIVVTTSADHGLPTGAYVKIAGVAGNTAANDEWFITSVSATTFSLDGSTGNGAYTTGGTWQTLGLWTITLTGSVLSSLEAGQTYTVVVTWQVSSVAREKVLTLTVQ
jgi:hypothetical protein